MKCCISTRIHKHMVWFCLRVVLELVWVQAQELAFPQPLLATRTPTMTMIIMPKTTMPTSMTTITITQMTLTTRMTFGKTCSQESSSLQPTVTQIFCELQIEMIFPLDHISLTPSCSLFSLSICHFPHLGALTDKEDGWWWLKFFFLLICFQICPYL